MIKKLNKIKTKKREDPKVMCNEVEALKVKYHDQAKILDNDTIVTHFLGVCKAVQVRTDTSSSGSSGQ